jgi:hypothetical protein
MSQNTEILAFLKTGHPLTAINALTYFSCFRLAARIQDLRDKGYRIETQMVSNNGRHYAEYTMAVADRIPPHAGESFELYPARGGRSLG